MIIFCVLTCFIVTASVKNKSHFSALTDSKDVPEPDQVMGKIIDKAANEIAEKYDFLPFGVGLSGKFQSVGLSFRVYRSMTKSQIRQVLFDCAEILLKNINNSKEIRSDLETYPFKLDNVGITLYFSDENYHRFPHPNLTLAKLGEFGLVFITAEAGDSIDYKEVTKETIEEARAILNKTSAQ